MKKRIISAIGMTTIILPLVILGGIYFAVAIGVVGIFALKEFIDLKEYHKKIPWGISIICILSLLLLIFSEFDGYGIAFGLNYKAIAIAYLGLFTPSLFYQKEKYTTKEAFYLSGCILFLGIVLNGIILIRNYDIWHLFYLATISITTDIFAMLVGCILGKHKCAPTISPFKTWEGTIGGTTIASIVASTFYIYFIGESSIIKIVSLTILLSIIGQLGDLTFSKIKRENKIKDFSTLIPGHGGILDRLDSLFFVVLAYIILFGTI